MSEILTTLAVFWLCAFVFYVLVHRGLWIFSDVARTMGMFMLEKALGPGIDLVEGRTGSAARAWIMQSALWLMIGGLFTFEGMWLAHEPTALHSLSAWGYDPTADTLAATGKAATAFGGITMALVGWACIYCLIYWAQVWPVREMGHWSLSSIPEGYSLLWLAHMIH